MFAVLPNAFAEPTVDSVPEQASDIRTELLTALELQLNVVQNLGREDLTANLQKSIDEVYLASDAELADVGFPIEAFRNHTVSLQQLDSKIQVEMPGTTQPSKEYHTGIQASSSMNLNSALSADSLSAPEYYTGILCPIEIHDGIRNNTDVVLTASIAVATAKVAWSATEVVCGLDAVALASGGIGTIACSAAAALVGTAEEILEGYNRCDATIDEAHLDAAFNRAADNHDLSTHIHTDLTSHDQSITADLATHDADIKSQATTLTTEIKNLVTTHDTEVKAKVTTHDTEVKTQVAAHDTEVKTQVAAHDTEVKTQVAAHDTEVRAQVAAHDTEVRAQVAAHDTEVKVQVAAHDADIKTQVAVHDTDVKAQVSVHDTDIKELLSNLQGAVNENQRLINISMARQAEILRLLLTPSGRRTVNPDVLNCTGDDCPTVDVVLTCKSGLKWPCK